MTDEAAPGSPSSPAPRFDFLRGLKFFFESPQWILHLAVLSLVGFLACCLIGVPYIAGYMYRMTHRTARGEDPLPPLSDVAGLFKDGLRTIAFTEIHLLLLLAPSLIGLALGFSLVGVDIVDPTVLPDMLHGSPAAAIAMVLAYTWLPIALLVAAVYLPAAHARLIVTGRFRDGFDVRANLAFIRRNLRNYGLMYLVAIVANLISNAGLLACGVGIYPATIWSVLVFAWAQGELVRCDSASA